MAASEGEPDSDRHHVSGTGRPPVVPIAAAVIIVILLWFFPLFHVVPLQAPAAGTPAAGAPVAFDAVSAAARIWQTELPAAARRTLEVSALVGPLRANAETAKAKFAKSSGLGAAYYFVRGQGRVVTRERNHLRVALDGASAEIIAIRIGPVFGNTVRDGCGFLDVNAFPGLQEFNALSAELNALVEKNVLPALRERAQVGATIEFAGCAEAPESTPDAGEPLLLIVPVQAEVR
jgi:predicted lipoprotein